MFFCYVVMQSLWNLREFQGECKKKLDADHRHVGTPCIVCAFFGIFAAKNRREAVDPTELRIALSYCHWNQNNLQLVCSKSVLSFKKKFTSMRMQNLK